MKKTYRDQIECLAAIGSYLVDNAPQGWELIEVNAKILEGRVVMTQKRFQPKKAGALESFRIEDPGTDVDFGDCFLQLSELVGDEETGPFKACRYVLQRSGRYHVEYEY